MSEQDNVVEGSPNASPKPTHKSRLSRALATISERSSRGRADSAASDHTSDPTESRRQSSRIDREREQQEIEGQHDEMVARLRIRLSSSMRVIMADQEDDENKPELKSLNHELFGDGGSSQLARILNRKRLRKLPLIKRIELLSQRLLWWFAGHPSLRNNQSCVIYHGSGFRRILDTAVALAALSTSMLVPLDLGFDVNKDYKALRLIDEINTVRKRLAHAPSLLSEARSTAVCPRPRIMMCRDEPRARDGTTGALYRGPVRQLPHHVPEYAARLRRLLPQGHRQALRQDLVPHRPGGRAASR